MSVATSVGIPGDRLVDPEPVVEPVEPGLVLQDWTADVGMELVENQVRVSGVAAGGGLLVEVVGDEALALVIGVIEAGELVTAALQRHHDERAGRRHLDVAAGGRRRELLDGVVVVVEAGSAGALGRVDAVGEHTVLVADAEALVAHLLALVAPADVIAAHPDAGRLAQNRPDVGRARDVLELFHGELVGERRVAHVDDRRLAGDGDGLGDGRDVERRVHRDGARTAHDDAFPVQRLEPGELERQVVRRGPQRAETVGPVGHGHCRLRAEHGLAGESHGDAREHQPLRVGDFPFDRASRLRQSPGSEAERDGRHHK